MKVILSVSAILIGLYNLITKNFTYIYFNYLILSLLLLVIGVEETKKDKKQPRNIVYFLAALAIFLVFFHFINLSLL